MHTDQYQLVSRVIACLHVDKNRLLVIETLAVSRGVLLKGLALVGLQAVPGLRTNKRRRESIVCSHAYTGGGRWVCKSLIEAAPGQTVTAASHSLQYPAAVLTLRTIASIWLEFALVS